MAQKKPSKIKQDIKDTVVLAALGLAERKGWSEVSLGDIAKAAKISMAELRAHFEDKTDILVALGRMIDRRVLDNLSAPDLDVPWKERVFDVLMERYDVLNEYRAGLLPILESFKSDPKQVMISLPHLCRSMNWMLEGAGVDTGGVRGAARLAGVTLIYVKALKAWTEDDSPDMAGTMASLDKGLGWMERLANTLGMDI
jgi:ubiquinone biosynthesis protein COQ9